MQLAMTGVRDLSIIASPPVGPARRAHLRFAVSTALLCAKHCCANGYGEARPFYVCPRIEDLAGAKDFLAKSVPEVRVAVAHGKCRRARSTTS
jgi:transcription-repair coupling factor (superfamily II helicase)